MSSAASIVNTEFEDGTGGSQSWLGGSLNFFFKVVVIFKYHLNVQLSNEGLHESYQK
jgi:hypothetical protein